MTLACRSVASFDNKTTSGVLGKVAETHRNSLMIVKGASGESWRDPLLKGGPFVRSDGH